MTGQQHGYMLLHVKARSRCSMARQGAPGTRLDRGIPVLFGKDIVAVDIKIAVCKHCRSVID